MKKTFIAFYSIIGIFLMLNNAIAQDKLKKQSIVEATINDFNSIMIVFENPIDKKFIQKISISSEIEIEKQTIDKNRLFVTTKTNFRLDTHYFITINNFKTEFLVPNGILDKLYSDKPMGYVRENNQLAFRLFAPRAIWVKILVYDTHDAKLGESYKMTRDKDGVWEWFSETDLTGKYYGYKVHGPSGNGEMFDSTIVIADPYSPATVSINNFTHAAKTIILPEKDDFQWSQDKGVNLHPRDLIMYEMHVRDLTAHPSSGLDETLRGTYKGLVTPNQRGGIEHIKKLGVNAVELLPIHDFGNIEIPYRDSTIVGYPTNTWNPYARNHWGYMTSYFFAPESYYASGGTMIPEQYNGINGQQVNEFKYLVNEFHKNDIAVIIDVVYNHVSQYDYNPFKYIDKFYYFRLKPNCEFESASGCGNDFKTERPMARRMIVESVLHWMREYRVDGFRFDLAAMIDWGTVDAIRAAAIKENPNVHLIAEPWGGGGYAPAEFSAHNWASWNDQIRNGLKGWNPTGDAGFIFGKWKSNTKPTDLQNYMMGTLKSNGGLFESVNHAVNYLESHDDHTLSDFIRLAIGEVTESTIIKDVDAHAVLSEKQLKINKLAAMALLVSQGSIMLNSGQEFARSKVIAPTDVPDKKVGHIDHNSYEKDNETNWLNFDHADKNSEIFDYYAGLIQLRKTYSALRHAEADQFTFLPTVDDLFLYYTIKKGNEEFLIVLNGHPEYDFTIALPDGKWHILADEKKVKLSGWKSVQISYNVSASSGIIFKKMN